MKYIQSEAQGAFRFSVAASVPVHRQLVIFPHAGGSAGFYRPWRDHLPADIDLIVMQYDRGRPSITTSSRDVTQDAIRHCQRGLANLLGIAPVSFFGHSMGALLAVHVAQTMAGSRFRIDQLVISSQMTPASLQTKLRTERDVDQLTEQAMDLGEVSDPTGDIKATVAAAVRHDLVLLKNLARLPIDKLPTTRIFGGLSDALVSRENLHEWTETFPTCSTPELFPGGHFYLSDEAPAVIGSIIEANKQIFTTHSNR